MGFDAKKVRNFAVAGHGGCGKTSLCDLALLKCGAVDRRGRTDQRTSVFDSSPEEQERQSGIHSSAGFCKRGDTRLFFMDNPGYSEFIGETVASIHACDAVLIVVDGVGGFEVGAARAWKMARELDKPRALLINRLDKDLSDFGKVLKQLQDAYGEQVCVPFTIPVGSQSSFSSVVSVLDKSAGEEAKSYYGKIMDAAAESDEELMMKYLDGQELSQDEISAGIRKAVLSGKLAPVFAGSAEKDIGIDQLLDGLASFLPPPVYPGKKVKLKDGKEIEPSETGPGLAFVFKTAVDPHLGQLNYFRMISGVFKPGEDILNVSANSRERFGQIVFMNGKNQSPADEVGPGAIAAAVKLKQTKTGNTLSSSASAEIPPPVYPRAVMSYAVTPAKSGEDEKMAAALHKFVETDPTIKLERQTETHELLLSGMGDQHIGIIIKKIKDTNKLEINLASPKIPYRETVTGHGEGHYRHKKQSGGHGQFGEVFLKIAPNEAGYEFANEVVGGNIPKNFIPAVEKGVHEAMEKGPLAGCLVERVKVSVTDGKYHAVDSNEMSFKIAGRMAFRDAMRKAKPVLLEPIMNVKILVPDHYMGDITGDLNHKRGRILGMSAEEGMQALTAQAPLAEMSRYATELRSMTQGRGSFEMDFAHYEIVPSNVANTIIANFKHADEEDL
jgi:elongation factor G